MPRITALLLLAFTLHPQAQTLAGAINLPSSTQPNAIAVDTANGKIYIANPTAATLSILDGQSPLATPTTITLPTSSKPTSLAIDTANSTLYIANSNGTVSALNTATNILTTSITIGQGATVLAADAAANTIFAASTDGSVYSIAGATNTTSQILPASSLKPSAIAIDAGSHAVIVANQSGNSVTLINEATASTPAIVLATIPTGNAPTALAVNPINTLIYVSNSTSNTVSVINPILKSVTATIPTGPTPGAIVADPIANQIYVASTASNTITLINGLTNTTTTIPVGAHPSALAILPTLHQLFIADSASSDVDILNTTNNTITNLPLSGQSPNAIAINPITNTAFVTSTGAIDNTVSLITNAVLNSTGINAFQPTSMAINPATGQLFLNTGGTLQILNTATNTIQSTTNLTASSFMVLNPITDTLYFASAGTTTNVLTSLNAQTLATTSVNIPGLPTGMDVNPVTNRIYITEANNGVILSIDGASGAIATITPATSAYGSQPYAVAVNPATNRIYVGDQQTENIAVIDGSTNKILTYIPENYYQLNITVDSVHNLIYVLDPGLAVIDGATNIRTVIDGGCYGENHILPDFVRGNLYLTGCQDGTISVYNIPSATYSTITPPTGDGLGSAAINLANNQLYPGTVTTNTRHTSYPLGYMDVVDAATLAISRVYVGGQGTGPVVVNPANGSVYTAVDAATTFPDSLAVLTPPATQPLTATVTPIHDSGTISSTILFATTNTSPAFTATVTSNYTKLPAYTGQIAAEPQPANLYYTVDGGEAWSLAAPTSTPGTFKISLTNITIGPHELYVYPTYGAEPGPSAAIQGTGNSPDIGNINGSYFYILPSTFGTLSPTTIALTASPNPQNFNGNVQLEAAATTAFPPTGTISFLDGTTVLTSNLAILTTSAAYLDTSTLSVGTHIITATYTGDSANAPATSNPVTVVINAAPAISLTATPTTLSLAAGSSTQSTLTLTSLYGYTGAVNLTCGGVPTNSFCSISPSTLNLTSGATQTATLTFKAFYATSNLNNKPFDRTPLAPTNTVALASLSAAALLLLTLTRRKHPSGSQLKRNFRRNLTLQSVGLLTLFSLTLLTTSGCTSGSSSSNTTPPTPTQPGSYYLNVTASYNIGQTNANNVNAGITVTVH